MTADERYVLVCTTNGDELFSPRETIIAESASREKLETLRDDRARERAAWMNKYGDQLPDYIYESLVASEDIRAVASI